MANAENIPYCFTLTEKEVNNSIQFNFNKKFLLQAPAWVSGRNDRFKLFVYFIVIIEINLFVF